MENRYLKIIKEKLTLFTSFFNAILPLRRDFGAMGVSEIILLYKKGDRKDIGNYRPISLTSNISKKLAEIMINRMYNQLENCQSQEQTGFRKGRSTKDQIFIINQLIDRCNEYNIAMFILLVDVQKAFMIFFFCNKHILFEHKFMEF